MVRDTLKDYLEICHSTCHSWQVVSEKGRGTVEVFSILEDRSWRSLEDKDASYIVYRRQIAVGPNIALSHPPLSRPLRFDANGRYRPRKHLKTPELGKWSPDENVVISPL